MHRAPTDYFKSRIPYVLAIIRLDEGFPLLVNIIGDNFPRAAIGGRVLVVFEKISEQIHLPQAQLLDTK